MAGGERIEVLVSDSRGLRSLRTEVRRLANSAHFAADDIVLAASELVTNALLYVEGPCRLRGWLVGGAVHIEVSDRGPIDLPAFAPAVPSARDGRGLSIVDQLVTRWDVQIHDGLGKTVWFEVDPARA
jgi:anti-sigma regulatory factor (Ser/Thr protein kinase)